MFYSGDNKVVGIDECEHALNLIKQRNPLDCHLLDRTIKNQL